MIVASDHRSAPRRPSQLDGVDDAAARAVLAAGQAVTFGPAATLAAGGFVAAVTFDGAAFRTYGSGLEHRATTATWRVALADLLAAAVEWDAAAQRSAQGKGDPVLASSSPR